MTASVPGQPSAALNEASECARVTADMLRRNDRDELAQAVERSADRPASALPTVVVVGETKRGKSSLVNALLHRPGLSPVDVDVATCVHIRFGYADTPSAQVYISGQGAPVAIDVDDLAQWACEQGNPGNTKGVLAIHVGLPEVLLRRVVLVDTPGVGGLVLGHRELTLQALGLADALLFVVDAGAPMSGTELTFLKSAAERIDTVAFALTKTDAYPKWRKIKARNAELLAVHAPRFANAPWIPISSVHAERALRLGEHPDARAERYRSGLTEAERILSESIADRAHVLRGLNTLRLCLRGISDMKQVADQQIAVAAGDPGLEQELAAEQQRVEALVPAEATWRAQINASLFTVKNDRSQQLEDGLAELKTSYDKLATEQHGEQELQQLAGQFSAAVEAMTIQLAEQTSARLVSDVIDVIAVIAEDATLREKLSQIAALSVDGPQYKPGGHKRMTGTEIYGAVTPVLSISRFLMPSTLGVTLAMGATVPIDVAALFVGGAAAFLLYQQKKKITRQNEFAKWTRSYIDEVRRSDSHAFGEAMNTATLKITEAFNAGIKRRVSELAEARKGLEKLRTQTQEQRETAAKTASDQRAKVVAVAERTKAAYVALQQTRASAPTPAQPPQ